MNALDLQAASVAVENDRFRRSGLRVTLTSGIQYVKDLNGLMAKIRAYDQFNQHNDPYGEHDFGKLMWRGDKVFWKIDYYDGALEFGEDPHSPNCQRVMTVMLADEY